ncbi:MAG: hypothetical protein GX558_09815 [Clostridiales bacterium]|nr:hypothetical protein [Clostridiales bacterium]
MRQVWDALAEAARALNEAKVHWGVGASLMLYANGLVGAFSDVDIVVADGCEQLVERALAPYIEAGRPAGRDHAAASWFRRARVSGVDFDLMMGFMVRSGRCAFRYRFGERSITARCRVQGASIPLCSLEEWYVLYQLMPGCEASIHCIERHFLKNGVGHPELIERMLSQGVPASVMRRTLPLLCRRQPVLV